jgi:hypothetical protein
VDGFCEILREQPCQILVVGVCDIFLDGLDFVLIHVGKQGIRFFAYVFFPFVHIGFSRAFSDGGSDGVDAVRGFDACHGTDFFLFVFVRKEVLADYFDGSIDDARIKGFLAQILQICRTKSMQPFRIPVQPDKLVCQFLVVVFGDVFPHLVQQGRNGFHFTPDALADVLVPGFIFNFAAGKAFRQFQAPADNL